MKLALRYIPTEVWVDIFCYPWISRKKLGRIVDRFRNRKFTEFLQFYLHEWGKRTLSYMELNKGEIMPRTLMPENIKFFKWIEICHFDSSTLAFLRRISTLFTGVNLDLTNFAPGDDLTNLRTTFDHLAPLLHGIHSMSFHHCAIPLVEQYFGPKLAQVKMLKINFECELTDQAAIQTTINFCMNWLSSEERDFGEPILLEIYIYWETFQQFCTAQFLSAKSQCTFAIELHYIFYDHNVDLNFRLDMENNLGEKLHGEFNEEEYFQILRYPVNFARAQLQEWVMKIAKKSDESSVIELCAELTIGPLDANTAENDVDGAGQEEEDGSSTSKKRKFSQ